MQLVLAKDRANRLLGEAESHRRALGARSPESRAKERFARSIEQSWSAIKASFDIDRRPRIPAS
jgi:hypothetical protein